MNIEAATTDNKSVLAFFVLAYLISWSIGIPLALEHQGIIPQILPAWTHYFVGFGPLLSATIVTAVSRGGSGLRDLGKRMVHWASPKWWLVALSPLLFGFVLLELQNLLTGNNTPLAVLGEIHFLPPLGFAALPLWIFTFGFGEETGWRGFALPRLEKERDALSATLILAGLWAFWHLPQFFYVYDLSIALLGWLVGLFAGAILLTWLYNSSGGSILMVALWHGSFNFVSASTADTGLLPFAVSALVIFWAITILRRTDPKSLITI